MSKKLGSHQKICDFIALLLVIFFPLTGCVFKTYERKTCYLIPGLFEAEQDDYIIRLKLDKIVESDLNSYDQNTIIKDYVTSNIFSFDVCLINKIDIVESHIFFNDIVISKNQHYNIIYESNCENDLYLKPLLPFYSVPSEHSKYYEISFTFKETGSRFYAKLRRYIND